MTDSTTWKAIASGLYLGSYMVGSNEVNTLVVDIGDGNLAAISPGTNVREESFKALDALGKVTALVSPGAFHNMGLPLWHANYPDAGLFSTESGIARIAQKHSELPALKSFDELNVQVSNEVKFYETPSRKHGDLLMFVSRGDEVSMFCNELMTNNAELPKNLVFKIMFKLTRSGPGLCFSNLACRLTGAERKTVSKFISERIGEHGMTRFVPCHGKVVEGADARTRVEAALAVAGA